MNPNCTKQGKRLKHFIFTQRIKHTLFVFAESISGITFTILLHFPVRKNHKHPICATESINEFDQNGTQWEWEEKKQNRINPTSNCCCYAWQTKPTVGTSAAPAKGFPQDGVPMGAYGFGMGWISPSGLRPQRAVPKAQTIAPFPPVLIVVTIYTVGRIKSLQSQTLLHTHTHVG